MAFLGIFCFVILSQRNVSSFTPDLRHTMDARCYHSALEGQYNFSPINRYPPPPPCHHSAPCQGRRPWENPQNKYEKKSPVAALHKVPLSYAVNVYVKIAVCQMLPQYVLCILDGAIICQHDSTEPFCLFFFLAASGSNIMTTSWMTAWLREACRWTCLSSTPPLWRACPRSAWWTWPQQGQRRPCRIHTRREEPSVCPMCAVSPLI